MAALAHDIAWAGFWIGLGIAVAGLFIAYGLAYFRKGR